jgi:hypothetical protein
MKSQACPGQQRHTVVVEMSTVTCARMYEAIQKRDSGLLFVPG